MKKLILLLTVVIIGFGYVYGQKTASGVSETKYISITKDPPKPPYLEIVNNSMAFSDTDGNNKIDANEPTTIRFELKNTGMGAGLGLKAIVSETNNITGLSFSKETTLGTLDPGKTLSVEIPITGRMDLTTSKASFSIKINA